MGLAWVWPWPAGSVRRAKSRTPSERAPPFGSPLGPRFNAPGLDRHLPLGHLSSRVHGVHPYDASALAAVTTDITLHDINQLRLYRTVHIHASTSVHPLHHLPTSKIHRRKAAVSFAAHAPRSILSRNRHRTPSLCRALPHERNVPSLPSPPSSSLSAARFPLSFRLSLSFLLLPPRCHTWAPEALSLSHPKIGLVLGRIAW